MPARTEERCNHPEDRQESLGVAGGLKAPHAPFSLSGRLVRVLRSVVQPPTSTMLHGGQHLCLGSRITAQLVSDDDPRGVLQTFVQFAKELLRCTLISPRLHQNVEHLAILVDGTPQILQPAGNPEKDFVEMPLVAGARAARAQPLSVDSTELKHHSRIDS